MPNPYVRGFPPEGPYNKVEIDKGAYTFTFEVIKKKLILTSIATHNMRVNTEEARPPESMKKAARKQAFAVIMNSVRRKKDKPA